MRRELLERLAESLYAIKRQLVLRGLDRAQKGGKKGAKGLENLHTITPSQWMVLTTVMRGTKVSVSDLSAQLGISSSAATQLVDALVRKRFLVRTQDKRDRRASFLALSPLAKKHLTRMKAERMKQLTSVFDALTDEELESYARLNKKITDALSAK